MDWHKLERLECTCCVGHKFSFDGGECSLLEIGVDILGLSICSCGSVVLEMEDMLLCSIWIIVIGPLIDRFDVTLQDVQGLSSQNTDEYLDLVRKIVTKNTN